MGKLFIHSCGCVSAYNNSVLFFFPSENTFLHIIFTMSKEVSLKDFYNDANVEEAEEDSEQDSDFVPGGKLFLKINLFFSSSLN